MPVNFTTNPAEWYAVDGVYIAELDQPAGAELESNAGLTKVVGQFPWGPTDELIKIGSADELKEKLFGKTQDLPNYKGYRALAGKKWGELHIVRVSESAQAKASISIRSAGYYTVDTYDTGDDYSLTFSSVDGGGPYTVTALSGEHSQESDVYTVLKDKLVNHSTLSEYVAPANVTSTSMEITGNGDEDWSVSLNTPATGAHSFDSPVEQYTLEALYPSGAGNQIQVEHIRETASTFSIRIEWGNDSTTYGPYDLDGQSSTADEISNDLQYTDFSWHANYNGDNPLDRENAVHLTGGSDASLGSSKSQPYIDGLGVLKADEDGGQIFCAEPELNETASDAVIAEGQTVADETRARYLHQAVGAQDTLGSRLSKVGTYSDDRLILAAHRVQQFIGSSLREVDLVPFVASAMTNTPPHISPAAYRNREYFQPVRDFESGVTPTRADYKEAVDVGALILEREKGGIWKLRSGITTDTTPGKELIARRVMVDLVGLNVGQALLPFQNEPPYPSNVNAAKGAMDNRLGLMQGSEDIPDSQLIENFQTKISSQSSDTVQFKIKVELWGEMRHLIAAVQVGSNVTITEEN